MDIVLHFYAVITACVFLCSVALALAGACTARGLLTTREAARGALLCWAWPVWLLWLLWTLIKWDR